MRRRHALGLFVCAAFGVAGCGSSATGGSTDEGSGGNASTSSSGGASSNGTGGAFVSSGGVRNASGGDTSPGGVTNSTGGGAASDGAAGTLADAGNVPDAASPPNETGFEAGVNVHNYPKPSAYGYVVADGKDRMGNAVVALGAPVVRGAAIGDTTFLARLASFGVKDVLLLLSASAEGKPFDPTAIGPLLKQSVDAAKPLGITVRVEGLNEWDLFNGKSYNVGVIPSGMTASAFVSYTQEALYEAAHPLGLEVLGPSVGHSTTAANVAFFPDVSAYVDIVNAHLYFGATPETLPVASVVTSHEKFQGTGKPFWVTETGISSYAGVTTASQADVIKRGLSVFASSKLISRAYIYELLDDQMPGLSGSTYTPDSAEYHFGLFTFAGDAKPSATSFEDFMGSP